MKRVHVTLRYTADFDDDFDTSLLQDVDRLIGFGVVSLLRKEPEQGVDVLPDASIDLRFPGAKQAKKGRAK
jgi:NADPH-dependent 7-cyano-7-deazaguanine reductase QueF-like protein